MERQSVRPNFGLAVLAFVLLFGVILVGVSLLQDDSAPGWKVSGMATATVAPSETRQRSELLSKGIQPTRQLASQAATPTPDAPHAMPTPRTNVEQYVVKAGDTLGKIGQRYSVTLEQLVQANQLPNQDHVEVGQLITIPLPSEQARGPSFKVIPDSELVYGPTSITFNVTQFVQSQGGYLVNFQEEVDGRMLSGAQIIQRVAQDYSVNPRLLLTLVEYQGGWVTQANPDELALKYPLGLSNVKRKGLYLQLTWTADNLNRGYYLWRVNGVAAWLLLDGNVVPIAPTINAGTAAVQHFFAQLDDRTTWLKAVERTGLFATYQAFFGSPFDSSVEPLSPSSLKQPVLQLPFEKGKDWSFTGGPHGGWGDGSAWAGLDFAPPGDALGCVKSDEWVVAVADGVIVRADQGAVIQDLDSDGLEQTGWNVLYMHIEPQGRVLAGTRLKAGERIGHPSCEGGVSNGTHVHIARKYNGEWIAADQNLPFNMEGWISSGDGNMYDGFLTRGSTIIEAYEGRESFNSIKR